MRLEGRVEVAKKLFVKVEHSSFFLFYTSKADARIGEERGMHPWKSPFVELSPLKSLQYTLFLHVTPQCALSKGLYRGLCCDSFPAQYLPSVICIHPLLRNLDAAGY